MATLNKAVLARRAWRALRVALLWACRGGSLKRGLVARTIRVEIKNAGRASGGGSSGARIRYLEREFSFRETPAFSFRMHRPASLRMLCIGAPAVDVDEEDDWMFVRGGGVASNGQEEYLIDDEGEKDGAREEEAEEEEEEGIDSKAEEFVANFYEQMKMQRQVSLVRYNEMPCRGVC